LSENTVRAAIGGLEIGKFQSRRRPLRHRRALPGELSRPDGPDRQPLGSGSERRNDRAAQHRPVVTTGTPVEINRFNRQRQIALLANLGDKPDGTGKRVLGDAVTDITNTPRKSACRPATRAAGPVSPIS